MESTSALIDHDHTTPPPDSGEPVAVRTYVTFDLGGRMLAADVSDVREILDLQDIAPLPNARPGLLGMIDLRGEGIAVVDLGLALDLSRRPDDADCRIIVLDLADGGAAVAIMADRVHKVIEIGEAAVEPVPVVPGGWNAGAMTGVARVDGRLVYLINLRRALGTGADAVLPGPFDFD